MRSGIRSRPSRMGSRLVRTGLALLLAAAIPAQAPALGAELRPGPVQTAPSKPQVYSVADESPASVLAKVQPSVLEAFKGSEHVRYLVKLRLEADVLGAATAARELAASPASAEAAARRAVVNSLQEAAEMSQAGLVSFLEKARSTGQVKSFQPFWIVNMVAVTSDRATMQKIAAMPEVEAIYEDEEVHLIRSEVVAVEEAEAVATGQPEWNIARIGAPGVWNQFDIDGTGVVVANLDTGVDASHPALAAQYRGNGASDHSAYWLDVVNGQPTPYDDDGHGTHTMGTMVGRTPDGQVQIGVAPGAQWIAVKILDETGSGYTSWILEGAQWLLNPGGDPANAPDVVNNSWGGGPGVNEWFRSVVAAWRAAGIVPIFAAGNSGPGEGSVAVPANYPESIAVGNIRKDDGLNGTSGRGPSPYGEIKPEVSAPGTLVRSALPDGRYALLSGTSMAAPHAAGVAALLRQADASLSVDEIEAILTGTAEPLTDGQYPNVPNNGFGYGVVDAHKAVASVLGVADGRIYGRMATDGDDFIAPTIQHTPVTRAFKRSPIVIAAEITDDVSLTAVYLRFHQPGLNWWGILDMTQLSGDHRGGTFAGIIPGELATADTVEYYIEAVDYGNNHAYSGSRTQPHVIALADGMTPGYFEDFEQAAAGQVTGWTTAGSPADLWQIGEPTTGPGAAYSGRNVAATNLHGNYPNSAEAYLITPPIDLRDGPAALRFKHWYDLETNYDRGIVAATANYGETWDILASFTGTSETYREAVVDLSAYAGLSDVYVAFILDSDGIITWQGWYIDDVELYIDEEAPAAPANLTAQTTPLGTVVLTWDPSDAGDLLHYTVYRSTSPGEGYSPIGSATQPTYHDTTVEGGTTYYYVVTATDFFGNESPYSTEVSATPPEVDVRFRDDMEAGPGEWTTAGTNNSWQWGVPTSGPGAAFSGENLWATNLSGNYPNSANASLISPPIDLSGLATAALGFTHWYQLERNYDYGRVEITTDGGETWTELAVYTSPIGSSAVGPETPIIDLTDYVGQTVQIRFRHTSDGSITYPGWYVDDVAVIGTATEANRVHLTFSDPGDAITLKDEKHLLPAALRMPLPAAEPSGFREDTAEPTVIINALPVMEGTVTVLETGRVVRTNPVDGTYSLLLPAGEYTLLAEAYGYQPQTRQVTLGPGEELSVNFLMEPIPRGQVAGIVTNAYTGEPIAGARVQVLEDARVAPAFTDAAGRFTLDLLVGTYTVWVSHPYHQMVEIPVEVLEGETTEIAAALDPFAGLPGELAYDDGTAETARAIGAPDSGFAVRMSPEPGRTVMVTGARVRLWGTDWPAPGGNSFQVAVYDSQPDGSPGRLLLGPIRVDNAVRGAWNEVDLRPYGLTVQGDFYLAVLQTEDYPYVPGVAFDETTTQGRTWYVLDTTVFEPFDSPGNAMIRALISTEMAPPVILSPADGTFTDQTEVLVEGTSPPNVTVTLYVNGAPAAETVAEPNGAFAAVLTLDEGEHALTAVATNAEGGSTAPSAPVRVIVDLTAPELVIEHPADGAVLNHRLLTVSGQAVDLYVAGVNVNGTAAEVDEDGRFTADIILREGENLVTVTATDRAGNQTSATVTVTVDSVPPELTNLQPDADLTLRPGDTLTVSFDSEPGLALAAFSIVPNLGGGATHGNDAIFGLEPGEMAMAETEPGHYEGTFTVPEGMSLPQAFVRFRAMDAAGNTVRATAPGLLTIVPDAEPGEPDEPGEPGEPSGPVAAINGPTLVEVNTNARWDADRSGSDVPIVRYEWDMGDGTPVQRGRSVTHRYREPGTYTITLTATDRNGRTTTATLEVVVTAPETEGPKAVIQGPTTARRDRTVVYSGIKSTSGLPIISYEWDMGDGTRALLSTPVMIHQWAQAGTYTVTLTVTDLAGNTDTFTLVVEVVP